MPKHAQEQLTKWVPIEGLSEKYYIDQILDSIEEFQLRICTKINNAENILVEENVLSIAF